jgi:hypothetical protein
LVDLGQLLFLKLPFPIIAAPAEWTREHFPRGFIRLQRPLQSCDGHQPEFTAIGLGISASVTYIKVGHGNGDLLNLCEIIDSLGTRNILLATDYINNRRVQSMENILPD